MSASETATEVVAEVAEEVADQATHVAEVSRGMDGHALGFGFGGLIIGLGLGATAGYIFCKRKLETKYDKLAAEEIAETREQLQAHFEAKTRAHENETDKARVGDIIRERRYDAAPEPTEPPMAVTPPTAVVQAAQAEEEDVEDEAVLVEDPEPEVRNVFEEHQVNDEWDWHKERSSRSPLRPFVIHREERDEQDAFDGVSYTYYEEDDVICNERDEIMGVEDRERVIGEVNLSKFGHGSDDANIVYIRNPQLEMDIEVVKSPNSYAQEVAGFEPEIRHADRRRGRIKFDDE